MSKARNLSDFISEAAIDATEIGPNAVTTDKVADQAVTPAKLHNSLDLSGKTVTLPTDGISGNSIHGGVISAFSSTGIDDNASSTAVTILSSGNVGIGTTSPSELLHVAGKVNISNGLAIGPAASSTYAEDSTLSSYATNNGVYLNGHQNGWLRLNGDGTNRASIDLYGSGYNNFNDEIHFKTGNVGNRLVISNDGNVGIGTSNPTHRLDILNDGGEQLRILAWDQSASARANIDFWYLDAGGSPYNNAQISTLAAANAGNGNLVFSTRPTSGSLTERMRITSTGDVGIGTTSPHANLHVQGTTGSNTGTSEINLWVNEIMGRSKFNLVATDDGTTVGKLQITTESTVPANPELVTILNNGNVGIGKNNPSTKLDVVGTIGQSFEGETWPSAVRKIYKGTITNSGSVNIFTLNGAELPFAGTIYISAYKSAEGVSGVWTAACIYPTVTPVVNQQSYVTRSDEFINLTWSVSNYSPTLRADFGNFSGVTYYTILVDGIVNQTYGTEEGSL